MKIEEGKLYFIKDEFIKKYNMKFKIMNNKNKTKRPCYFCFRDKKNKNILWFIPMSTKYYKYKKIEREKIKRFGKCYNFVFDTLIGKKQVFLIQNMFPTLDKYIDDIYIKDNKEVLIPKKIREQIKFNSINIISLAFQQNIDLTFTKIVLFYNEIQNELE